MWGTRRAHRRSLGFARDDKKERVAERRGPLPRARAVVGAVATSISSPFCANSKKVTSSRGIIPNRAFSPVLSPSFTARLRSCPDTEQDVWGTRELLAIGETGSISARSLYENVRLSWLRRLPFQGRVALPELAKGRARAMAPSP